MSNQTQRKPYAEAASSAVRAIGMLAPYCARIEIAGSLRRCREDAGDVELVAVPRYEDRPDMFGNVLERIDLLDEACRELLACNAIAPRPDIHGRAALGPKYKRLLFESFPLDLFITSPESWGCVFLIRTGPAEFSRKLVTKASQGGWLPRGFLFREGRLWKVPPPYDVASEAFAKPLSTPHEADVFEALGYSYIEPRQRSGDRRPPWLTAAQQRQAVAR